MVHFFALVDTDPNCESGSGSRDPNELENTVLYSVQFAWGEIGTCRSHVVSPSDFKLKKLYYWCIFDIHNLSQCTKILRPNIYKKDVTP